MDLFSRGVEMFRYDKVTRLEGICVEELFGNTFLQDKEYLVSKGWWLSKRAPDARFGVVKHLVGELTELDLRLAATFTLGGSDVYFIHKRDSQFSYCRYSLQDTPDTVMSRLFLSKPLPQNSLTHSVKITTREEVERMQEVLDYLKSTGADLKELLESRILANFYGSKYMWDIDYFILYKNKIYAFEVKQKFPTSIHTFGLNSGSLNVLRYLTSLKLPVFHVVLTKPVAHRSFSAVRQLLPDVGEGAKWLAHPIAKGSFNSHISESPAYTSFDQKRKLRFYHEPVSRFCELGGLFETSADNLKAMLDAAG